MPDPEPITIMSNFSVTTPHKYKRRRGKANKLSNGTFVIGKSFMQVMDNLIEDFNGKTS
jgi:hypothetical protein